MCKDFFMAWYDTGLPTLHGPFATVEEMERRRHPERHDDGEESSESPSWG